jgi:hypothetical protein
MNKKILSLTLTLLAVAMLATPVMATAPEKIPVFFFGGSGVLSPPEVWVSGNVQHGRGATVTYERFWIGMTTTPSNTWLMGPSLWTADYNVNLNNGVGLLKYKVIIELFSGTFEGNIIFYGEFTVAGPLAKPENGFMNGVLYGTGEYQGWRLDISGETINGGLTREMYMFIP